MNRQTSDKSAEQMGGRGGGGGSGHTDWGTLLGFLRWPTTQCSIKAGVLVHSWCQRGRQAHCLPRVFKAQGDMWAPQGLRRGGGSAVLWVA